MNAYVAPVRDMLFALFDVVEADKVFAQLPGGDAVNRELVDAVLQEGAVDFAEGAFAHRLRQVDVADFGAQRVGQAAQFQGHVCFLRKRERRRVHPGRHSIK